jgi:hypothetical protein
MNFVGVTNKSHMTSQSQIPTTTVSTSTILTTILHNSSLETTIEASKQDLNTVHTPENEWKIIIPIIAGMLFLIGTIVVVLMKFRNRLSNCNNREDNTEIPLEATEQHTDTETSLSLEPNPHKNEMNQHLKDSGNVSLNTLEDDDHNKSSLPLLQNEDEHSVNIESPTDEMACTIKT